MSTHSETLYTEIREGIDLDLVDTLLAHASVRQTVDNRLKRKYEPDEAEVLLDKILVLSNHDSVAYMRVKIFTGECMKLTLIPSTRNNGDVSDWEFEIGCTRNNVQNFGMFDIYRVYVGDGGDGHELLVTFDHKGVRIRELDLSMYSGDLRINVLPDKPEIALTHGDSA
eukprot:COSAG01_NODE_773_length_13704_cov_9.386843_14_plen_169_part_00